MSTVINVVEATVRDAKDTIEGKVLSRPTLIYTDGINVTYGCDVDIGMEGVINENGDIGILPLKNVPIASGNLELTYAEVGNAVLLKKSTAGHWEITGFAKTVPGKFSLQPVTITGFCIPFPLVDGGEVTPPIVIIGTPVEISTDSRPLTYGELSVYGIYGIIPYGAIGVFQNDVLVEIRSY